VTLRPNGTQFRLFAGFLYDIVVRRAFSILLLVVFSVPLIAPAFASAPDDSQLPACCRRAGKHHCGMNVEVGGIPSSFHVISARCPYSPFTHGPLMPQHAFAAPADSVSINPASGTAAVVRQAEAGYRVSTDRTRHKRGPPQNLAL
jgi:hypothetical protein